jgi:hypothetical protein
MTFEQHQEAWLTQAKAQGHTLRVDEDGDVDIFAVEGGYHNGPACETCGWGACMHCLSADEIPACTTEARAQHQAQEAEWERRSQLQKLAPDHALLLAALVSGRVYLNPYSAHTTVVVDGQHEFECPLDPFGCPILSDALRAALAPAPVSPSAGEME